ncbi:TIGR02679 family protein [Alkalihalobacillus pseudalcaliphilus]|uniref:TIGR02679 family protein n=1 Tax=Alkalihalobacillus pseudalcaliphilus TaxID=79884 RepID=UPI00069EF5FA|nr:TIGR02679 family protein [Alkalihalobacillus pseudalcaliphilus]
MIKNNIEEAYVFFHRYPVYRRLFHLFKDKYQSLGKIAGTVKVNHFSAEDLEELASFLAISSKELELKEKISLLTFQKQLARTRFGEIGLLELLEAFFHEKILTKKELDLQKQQAIEKTFHELRTHFSELSFWLWYVQEKTSDTYWIHRLLNEKKGIFHIYVKQLHDAYVGLSAEPERIAIFSQRVTGNPHAFDHNTELGKLFLHVLALDEKLKVGEAREVRLPTNTESINQLLETYGLFRDDITNYVTAVNLMAETIEGIEPVWQAAALRNLPAVLNIPIRELTSLEKAYPLSELDEKKVWIVENSGVFSTLLDQFPKAPLICTHGHFKLASLKLIDLLVRNGCKLMYAGDFDPEGLLMLQRLQERYGGQVKPWRMDVNHYVESNPRVKLSEERLSKLKHLHEPLQALKHEMQKRQKAGYQEAIMSAYLQDLSIYERG